MRLLLSCFGFLLITVFVSAQTVPNPTQVDSLIIDNGATGKADPADRIRYKVTISNTAGPNATDGQLTISPDPRTTFVPGSFRSSPLALPDSYACTGNVPISVPAASGLKANDFDDSIAGATISAGTFATTGGGSITTNADGSFTYTPAAGFTGGNDTYTYTLNDGNGVGAGVPATDMAVVTFTVSNLIWFIDNSAGAGDGRRNTPFNSSAAFNAGSAAAADVVYIEHTGTNYTSGIVLANNERLFGEGHTGGANLSNVLPFTLAAHSVALPNINGSRPFITNAAGAGIQLAMNNTIRGVDAGTTAGGEYAIRDNANNVGALTISEVAISNTLGAFRSSVGGTLNVNFISINASAGGAVNGIFLQGTNSGTFNGGSGAISGMAGSAILISGGTVALDYDGSLSKSSAGRLVDIQSHNTGAITIDGSLSSTGSSNGIFINGNTGGTISFTNGTKTLNTGASNAVTLTNNTGATISFTGGGLAVTTTSDTAFVATGGGTVNVTGANNTIVTGSAPALVIQNTNAGGSGIALDSIKSSTGQIANIASSTGIKTLGKVVTSSGGTTALNLSSAGTVNAGHSTLASSLLTTTASGIVINTTTLNLAGAGIDVTATGTGVGVSCTGGTVSITGSELDITTTSGVGFNATSGTVSLTGSGHSINSTSAIALNIVNATIAAGNLNFLSISSGNNTAAADPANGIVLNNTGVLGGLTVTGNGNTTQGGDNSGGTIQNTTGDAISLTTTRNISLTNMRILDIGGVGAQGIDASNLQGSNFFIAGRMTNVGSAGSGNGNGITLVNTTSSLTLFSVENSIFQNSLSGTSHVLNNPNGAISARLDVKNSLFEGLEALAVQSNSGSNAIVITNITDNIFRNASANGQGGTAVTTAAGSLGSNTFLVSGNTYFGLNNGVADGANAGTAAFQTTGGLLTGTISNNVLGTAADNNGDRRGIEVVSEPDVDVNGNTGSIDIVISGNTINRYTNREAIFVDLREDTQNSDLIIQNNNIGNLTGFVGDVGGIREAIDVQVRGEVTYALDLLVTGNTVTTTSDVIGVNIEVNADAGSPGAQTLNATVTSNTFVNLGTGTNLTARTRLSDPLVTLCLNMSGNTMEGAAGSLHVTEDSGTVNCTQTSSGNLSSVNGGVIVTLVGAPAFGQPVCLLPN